MAGAAAEKASNLERIVRRALRYYAYSRAPSAECPIFPEYIHVEPTNACNLRCGHCHRSSAGTYFTKQRGRMSLDLYRRIIDEIAELNSRISLDAQGEPLLHPHILEMIAYGKGNGLSVSILTNATRLTEARAERILDLKTDRVVFSFEGSSRQLHERNAMSCP
jgi:MoaA/NifB/PqqE/SkfB family radical SAM enzyme